MIQIFSGGSTSRTNRSWLGFYPHTANVSLTIPEILHQKINSFYALDTGRLFFCLFKISVTLYCYYSKNCPLFIHTQHIFFYFLQRAYKFSYAKNHQRQQHILIAQLALFRISDLHYYTYLWEPIAYALDARCMKFVYR